MTRKEEILKRLLDSNAITIEELFILNESTVVQPTINIPYVQPYLQPYTLPYNPNSPYWYVTCQNTGG